MCVCVCSSIHQVLLSNLLNSKPLSVDRIEFLELLDDVHIYPYNLLVNILIEYNVLSLGNYYWFNL